jgi:hypothetical protein
VVSVVVSEKFFRDETSVIESVATVELGTQDDKEGSSVVLVTSSVVVSNIIDDGRDVLITESVVVSDTPTVVRDASAVVSDIHEDSVTVSVVVVVVEVCLAVRGTIKSNPELQNLSLPNDP